MADYTAIGNAGETLVGLLRDRMSGLLDTPKQEVVLDSPADVDEDDVRIGLYLYDVSPNAQMQNDPPPRDRETRHGEPLRLDLRYVMTAYPSTGRPTETKNTARQHEFLGRAMQVLQEESILTGSVLVGSFDPDETLTVSILPRSRDEMVDLWNTFTEEPYRPSVAYLVTPVVIESTREESVEPVVERDLETYLPGGGNDE